MLLLIGLLVFPVMAVRHQGVEFLWIGAYTLALSALTYWAYAHDKRSAQQGAWRVPESQLHLLELLGGWPGAFLAQRRLRHKCSKRSYLTVFWLIILSYQIVAVDSLRDWQSSRAALDWIQARSGQLR